MVSNNPVKYVSEFRQENGSHCFDATEFFFSIHLLCFKGRLFKFGPSTYCRRGNFLFVLRGGILDAV